MKGMSPAQFAAAATRPQPQFAALCWRHHGNAIEVLLVSSRETRRWVLPKGWPIDGLDGPQTAVQEA
jgi:8-oxo-dGTP pyrophosphatase MutT (NUDIX family)